MIKKRTIKTIIIILLVLTITITAPVGSYINSITQSNQIAHADLMGKATGFVKSIILGMIAGSMIKEASVVIVGSTETYIQSAIELFTTNSMTMAQMTQILMKYPSLLFALKADRVDLLTEQEIDPYIEESLAYQSEYMGLTLEEKKIAIMEARMNLADGNLSVSELYKYQGIREIAAAFINFFTNQLIQDGYITQQPETTPLYQSWESVGDSPMLTSLYPYQYVMRKTLNNQHYLFLSTKKMYQTQYGLVGGGLSCIWEAGTQTYWEPYSIFTGFNTSGWVPVEANHDVYTSDSLTQVYFAKTTTDFVPAISIDDFLEDTTNVSLYSIAANPTYDPESLDPADHEPFVAPLPGIDTPTGDLVLTPGTVASDGTITRDIEGVTETVNNVDVQVDVRVDTATMEELLRDIADNTATGQNFRVPNLPNFLNLLLMILINIFKFIVGFLALVIAFRGIPATNYLMTDPNLIATINWWKTVNIPGFELNLMQIITGFLVLMTIIRLLAILRSFIAKRAVYFSTEIEKDAIFEEWDANAKWGDPNSRQFAEYKADREVRKRKEKLGKPIEKYIRTNKQKLKR